MKWSGRRTQNSCIMTPNSVGKNAISHHHPLHVNYKTQHHSTSRRSPISNALFSNINIYVFFRCCCCFVLFCFTTIADGEKNEFFPSYLVPVCSCVRVIYWCCLAHQHRFRSLRSTCILGDGDTHSFIEQPLYRIHHTTRSKHGTTAYCHAIFHGIVCNAHCSLHHGIPQCVRT